MLASWSTASMISAMLPGCGNRFARPGRQRAQRFPPSSLRLELTLVNPDTRIGLGKDVLSGQHCING